MSEIQRLPTAAQIKAALELYKKAEYWQLEDKILTELREKDPDFTNQQLTLIKATLVNSFYSAGCREIEVITSWIVNHKPKLPERYKHIAYNNETERIDLVRRIALYGRGIDSDGCIVFASKFAHFFLDAEAYPIYDQYARMLLHFHLNTFKEGKQPSDKYGLFYMNFFQLKKQLERRDADTYLTKTIDCYLWMAGQYVAWKKGISKQYYIASRIPFDDPDNQHHYESLFPHAMMETISNELLLSQLDLTSKQKEMLKSHNI